MVGGVAVPYFYWHLHLQVVDSRRVVRWGLQSIVSSEVNIAFFFILSGVNWGGGSSKYVCCRLLGAEGRCLVRINCLAAE